MENGTGLPDVPVAGLRETTPAMKWPTLETVCLPAHYTDQDIGTDSCMSFLHERKIPDLSGKLPEHAFRKDVFFIFPANESHIAVGSIPALLQMAYKG